MQISIGKAPYEFNQNHNRAWDIPSSSLAGTTGAAELLLGT